MPYPLRPFLLALLLLGLPCAFAQSDARITKVADLYKAGQYDESIASMRKIIGTGTDPEQWDLLVVLYQGRYEQAEKDAKNTWLKEKMDPKKCYAEFIDVCREASLKSESNRACLNLRTYEVDEKTDTSASEEVKKNLKIAERYFGDREYDKAMAKYRQVLTEHPSHFQATMYIGDCHYLKDKMDSAAFYFRAAIAIQPALLEPRKYLVDAEGNMHHWNEAMEACSEAMACYPDISMWMKLADAAEGLEKKMDRHWFTRSVELNRAGVQQEPAKGIWKHYRDAKAEIEPYCDSSGVVVKDGAPDGAKYMEVHCWERMLKSGEKLPKEMGFAKEMMDAGYLDCYVLVAMFHYDALGQFRHLAANEHERVKTFITEQVVH